MCDIAAKCTTDYSWKKKKNSLRAIVMLGMHTHTHQKKNNNNNKNKKQVTKKDFYA